MAHPNFRLYFSYFGPGTAATEVLLLLAPERALHARHPPSFFSLRIRFLSAFLRATGKRKGAIPLFAKFCVIYLDLGIRPSHTV